MTHICQFGHPEVTPEGIILGAWHSGVKTRFSQSPALIAANCLSKLERIEVGPGIPESILGSIEKILSVEKGYCTF
jgi:hypothetical protein